MKRIYLSLFIGGLLLIQALIQTAYASDALPIVSQTELATLTQDPNIVIVDVRTAREYTAGHIPGAINMPHRDIISGKINFDALTGKKLVLYCHTGVRVGIVDKYAQKNPLFPRENMWHLQGDFRAWQARGRPISKP